RNSDARKMGRSWFSAIKRVFIPSSKDKPVNGSEKKSTKEKKKGKLRHAETKSFIRFREPSSIEKILGEVDQQKLLVRPPTPAEQPNTPTLAVPRASSPWVASPRARKSFRALRGLVRLQGVVRGQNVKRQTMSAMKMMQLLVRVQTQIQSRRIQMLENQALQRQPYKNDKDLESNFGKWTVSQSEAGQNENWDDSLLTKEEREARMQKKVEAMFKRERAMSYAYSHKLWRTNPKSAQTSVMDTQAGGFPWWWNWVERELPPSNPPESQTAKSFHPTPPKPSPRPAFGNYKQQNIRYDNIESSTPRSTRSAAPIGIYKQPNIRYDNLESSTPRSTRSAAPIRNSLGLMKNSYQKPRTSAANSPFDVPLKDDDSLMSCPPFSVPNYMTPTVSAKAKARPFSNPRERFPGTPTGTPTGDPNRRFSFPMTPNIGSFKWNKGSSSKGSPSKRVFENQQSLQSVGDLSIDSTLSMPAAVGRKPFNRFV
ncbi:hypothetical protein C3L33_17664, partial [Rhododendron williamsianum]